MTPRVIGLDLSLTATGVATPDRTFTTGGKLPKDAPDMLRCERIAAIRDVVYEAAYHAAPEGRFGVADLVVMEGFSFGSPQGATEAGGLGWAVRVALHEAGIPFAVVPPTTLKKYACGKGNADKTEMVVAARERLGYDGHDNNVADALWLQAMGLERLGCPVVDLPAVHRARVGQGRMARGGGVMVIARNLTHLRPVATCAGEDCLRIPVTCPCGATVAAGDGHDCSKPWGGYWLCECGHCTRHHNAWWDDMNGQSGMGCDVCDCGNPEEVT